MTGKEADELGRRLALHLRRNEFDTCREILNNREVQRSILAEEPIALAEVIDVRWANALEAMGCIYIKDLEGKDLKFFLRDIPNVGEKALEEILGKVRPYLSNGTDTHISPTN